MDKQTLSQYQVLEKEIDCLKNEIERLRDSLSAPPIIDGMPKAKAYQDRIANLVAKIVDLDNILTDKLSDLVECRIRIEEAISTLETADRLLLRLRYIDGEKWEDVADKMGYSWQGIHLRHSKALKKIENSG